MGGCKWEKASPPPKKADTGAFAVRKRKHGGDFIASFPLWHMVRTLASGPNFAPHPLVWSWAWGTCPALLLSVVYQLLGEGSKFRWMWAGSKGRVETHPSLREAPTASLQKPHILQGVSRWPCRSTGVRHFISRVLWTYFIFSKNYVCEFYVYWQAFENVFNFVMFTNDLFTCYLLE